MRKRRAYRPQLLRLGSPAGADRPKQLVCLPKSLAARDQLWRMSGGGLSTIGMRPASWEFHCQPATEQFSRRPEWRKRLQKVHSQGRRSLPARDGSWRELDSSLSSDALLMNIFCYPGVTRRMEVCRILGLEPGIVPRIWIHAPRSVTQRSNRADRSRYELGNMLFEAKLTEGRFSDPARGTGRAISRF